MATQAERDTVPQEPLSVHYDTRLPQFPLWRRLQIPFIAAGVYSVIRTLGPTLRFEILGYQNVEHIYAAGQRCIYVFWHRVMLPSAWWFRHRGIVVLNTTHFDGQWTRKVVEWLGYGTAQGSSTRGGLRGLAMMDMRLRQGRDVAFTVDGPRGPRYVAKPGPVMLARRTGFPVIAFHFGAERGHTFDKMWDHFLLPHPFTRMVLVVAPALYVAQDAGRDVVEEKHAEMQRELERVRDIAENWFVMSEVERERYRGEFNA